MGRTPHPSAAAAATPNMTPHMPAHHRDPYAKEQSYEPYRHNMV